MVEEQYQYSLELMKEGEGSLGQVPVQIDWDPAFEGVGFQGIRQGRLPPRLAPARGVVRPIWHPELGAPYVDGFGIRVPGKNGDEITGEVPTAYLAGLAQQASSQFVDRGRLQAGERFRYLVMAFPRPVEAAGAPGQSPRFSVAAVAQPLRLLETRLETLMDASVSSGASDPQDMPVFMPEHVLDEASALTRAAGANETGGILIGRLHHDASVPEIAAEVTAQIPAAHTRSELTRLTFTAETWAAVQAAINLRRRDEIYLGWWHSHSFMKEMCKDCDLRKSGACDVRALFMSAQDCALHRAVFSRAYSIALVISDSPCTGLTWELFGWRYGMVARRGVRVLRAPRPEKRAAATAGVAKGDVDGTT